MSKKTLGAINDLTIASEFIMGAVRDLAAGKEVEHAGVQQQIDWAVRKIKGLHLVPTPGHNAIVKGREKAPT